MTSTRYRPKPLRMPVPKEHCVATRKMSGWTDYKVSDEVRDWLKESFPQRNYVIVDDEWVTSAITVRFYGPDRAKHAAMFKLRFY